MGALMKLSEAARRLDVSVRTVRLFIANGLLVGYRLGKKGQRVSYVSAASVERLVEGGVSCSDRKNA